jgi:uncharacterized protein (DUF302 family)
MRRALTPFASALVLAVSLAGPAVGQSAAPYPGTVTVATKHSFDTLVGRVEQAIAANKMGLVAQASASRGASSRGVKIPGNAVLEVFRNDYAVRMLAASVPAGIEAPLRIYVTENPDRTASITYREPTAVFAPYGSKALDGMARELDPIFARIVRGAAGTN